MVDEAVSSGKSLKKSKFMKHYISQNDVETHFSVKQTSNTGPYQRKKSTAFNLGGIKSIFSETVV